MYQATGDSAIRRGELYDSFAPPAWYAACVDREEHASRDLGERGVEVWMPQCRVVVSRRRKRTIVDGPMYPGYLFVRGVLTDEWLAAVLGVRDVVDMIRSSSRPIAACEGQMTLLKQLVAESGGRVLIEDGRVKRGFDAPLADEPFEEGQILRVLDGPFTGFNAIYKQMAGKERLKIFVDLFGRTSELEIDEASVQAVA